MDELNRWAKDELRSLNAQIEYILRDALRRQRRPRDGQPDDDQRNGQADDDRRDD